MHRAPICTHLASHPPERLIMIRTKIHVFGSSTNGGFYSNPIAPYVPLRPSAEVHCSRSKGTPGSSSAPPSRPPCSPKVAYMSRKQRKAQLALRCFFDLVQILKRQDKLRLVRIRRIPHAICNPFLGILHSPA